jgi:hypothetical protein
MTTAFTSWFASTTFCLLAAAAIVCPVQAHAQARIHVPAATSR